MDKFTHPVYERIKRNARNYLIARGVPRYVWYGKIGFVKKHLPQVFDCIEHYIALRPEESPAVKTKAEYRLIRQKIIAGYNVMKKTELIPYLAVNFEGCGIAPESLSYINQ